mmetsp:Transcript_22081/g.71238  ORF Transcript_22081/g.71238 Transcript_22081/m.71238 type:complete len:241 (-) Transcript_22081:771-1493(-)
MHAPPSRSFLHCRTAARHTQARGIPIRRGSWRREPTPPGPQASKDRHSRRTGPASARGAPPPSALPRSQTRRLKSERCTRQRRRHRRHPGATPGSRQLNQPPHRHRPNAHQQARRNRWSLLLPPAGVPPPAKSPARPARRRSRLDTQRRRCDRRVRRTFGAPRWRHKDVGAVRRSSRPHRPTHPTRARAAHRSKGRQPRRRPRGNSAQRSCRNRGRCKSAVVAASRRSRRLRRQPRHPDR